MKDLNRKALVYSMLGMLSVMIAAFLTDLLAPQNQTGELLRFSIPVITGIMSGAAIFLKLKEETDIDFEELGED